MSTQATPTPEATDKTVRGVAIIAGRIRSVRASRGQRKGYLHVIVLPAPDEFTSPSYVEVFAADRLGEPDATWRGKVTVGGYRRTYQTEVTDRDGEIRKVTVETADMTLTAI